MDKSAASVTLPLTVQGGGREIRGSAMANIGTREGSVRIAVVDHDENTHQRLGEILKSANSFTLAGRFSHAREALEAMPRLRPDLALTDLKLPDMDGVECTRRLRKLMPGLNVVIVSGSREVSSFDRSFDAGAIAYLVKPLDPDQLAATIRFAARPADQLPEMLNGNAHVQLNPRELVIICKIAEGLLHKEISDSLGISYAAVHKSQHRIFKKLRVTNRSEAVRVWLEGRYNFHSISCAKIAP